MAQSQQVLEQPQERGLLAHPLDALIFLMPLLLFYEVVSIAEPERVLAFDLLRRFFELFGEAGMWAPGVGVIVILLATHAASGKGWAIRWKHVGWMYVESAVWAIPLLALNWAIPLSNGPTTSPGLLARLALGVGAGVYEELVFRLILISIIVMIGVDVLRLGRTSVAMSAILLSSLAFAAHHCQPIGIEPFESTRFIFRTMAGVYLALIFWYRGYGSAAGCHAAYNVALVVIGPV
ncbi:MAG: CPBP family intramembrane metalloprotease [Phycisphaerales bacterium]|nr:MAG: CPBP family intramembrane metalloprotease [Phycisphaerales bacterium]